jgi:hypothetical protein
MLLFDEWADDDLHVDARGKVIGVQAKFQVRALQ